MTVGEWKTKSVPTVVALLERKDKINWPGLSGSSTRRNQVRGREEIGEVQLICAVSPTRIVVGPSTMGGGGTAHGHNINGCTDSFTHGDSHSFTHPHSHTPTHPHSHTSNTPTQSHTHTPTQSHIQHTHTQLTCCSKACF